MLQLLIWVVLLAYLAVGFAWAIFLRAWTAVGRELRRQGRITYEVYSDKFEWYGAIADDWLITIIVTAIYACSWPIQVWRFAWIMVLSDAVSNFMAHPIGKAADWVAPHIRRD